MAQTFASADKIAAARACYNRGDLPKAAELYRDILDEDPANKGEALQVLGAIAQRMGKIELALQLAEAALEIAPNMVEALINKAVILRQMGRKPEARVFADKALRFGPHNSGAWHTASFLALEAREYDNAVKWAKEAVRLAPDSPLALANYASALMIKGDMWAGYEHAKRALKLAPNEALMHLTIGQILRASGYPAKAVPYFRQAYAIKPDYIDAKTAEAAALTVMGDYENGWAAWEARPYNSSRFEKLPRWNGQPVQRLILHAEQGMGDAIQFLRWMPFIIDRISLCLTLQVPRPLLGVISATLPGIPLIAPDDELPEADAHCPMMSLPYLLKENFTDVPLSISLNADDAARKVWRKYLADMPSLRVGIVWAGNPDHSNDHNRSVPRE
ncbi:MAG: tetratricopeptide repeat protein, partial [Alphaproteobacteria bacterium]|nr:tetratricopeptide repeat protein [Alphaproteobacteria bacterium]